MKSNEQIKQELENIISQGLEQYPLPYQKGNSIRLRNLVIRKHKNGYRIFDCQTNKHVQTLFSKAAALAFAKQLVSNKKENIDDVVRLDNRLNKHYMDALFSKRTMEISKDPIRVDNAEIRYDIACDKVYACIDAIESYIFDK